MEIVVFYVFFVALIGFWASSWGRNVILWLVVALVISPLIAGIALAITGKTIQKKAEEQKAVRDLMD